MTGFPFFRLAEYHLLKKGGLALLFLVVASVISYGQTSLPLVISPYPEDQDLTEKCQQTQQILKALFLEKHDLSAAALRHWRSLTVQSEAIDDHIFQNELLVKNSLNLDSIPATAVSLAVAVSYLNWQKRWQDAYQLLQDHSARVNHNEELLFVRSMLGLHLRRYSEVREQLQTMEINGVQDTLQLRLLWSWYFILTEQPDQLKEVLEDMAENAFYYPPAIVILNSAGYPWEQVKRQALKALVRFPSDTELIEQTLALLQKQGALRELEQVLDAYGKQRDNPHLWTMRAELYLENGRMEQLKDLLSEIQGKNSDRLTYLSFRARIAIAEENWDQLRQIAEQLRMHYPGLGDGDRFFEMYRQQTERLPREVPFKGKNANRSTAAGF